MPKPKMKLPPGAELVDDADSSSLRLPPGAELVPELPKPTDTVSAAIPPGQYKMYKDGKEFNVEFDHVASMDKLGYVADPKDAIRYLRDKTYKDKVERNKKYVRPILNALPTIGGVFGGLFAGGGAVETGPGAIIAGTVGAAAGGAGGEDLRQMGQEYFFNEGPKSVKESAKEIGKQAAIQGGSELTGRVGAKLISPAARYYGETAKESEKAGFRMLPSEARGVAPGTLETYPKGSMFTAGTMAKWRELQNTETEAAARRIADSVSSGSLSTSGSRKGAGDAIRAGIEQHTKAFRRLQNYLYKQIEQKSPGVTASRADIVAFAKKALDEINKAQLAAGKSELSPFAQTLKSIVDNKAPSAPFSAMAAARSGWLSEVRASNQLLSGSEKGLLKKLSQLADESMMDAAKNSGVPGLEQAVRDANKLTREEHERFSQELVKKMVDKKNPEAIAVVLRGNPTSIANQIGIDETRAAMEIIPKNLIPKVQKQVLLDTIEESTDAASGSFNERKFAKSILQIGDERGKVLFGNNWGNIKDFSRLLNRITGSVGKSGAASLANPQVYKEIPRFLYETVIGAAGAGAASRNPILSAAAGAAPVVGEAILWKTIAAGLTHPATAERLFKGLQHFVALGSYAPGALYNESAGKQPAQTWEQLKKKSEALIKPKEPTPVTPSATPAAAPTFVPVPTPQISPDADTDTDEGPQSMFKITHYFDPSKGMIVPA